MKKFSVITFVMMCTLLFSSNISTSYAEEVHSKVTGTLIQSDEAIDISKPDESDSNEIKQPPKNDSVNKKQLKEDSEKKNHSKGKVFSKLPQAGEESNLNTYRMGFLLVLISWIVILVKRRRNSNENK